ncbi:MAG TPA: ketose-bisphosphate aldolase [Oribacterium sp.]|nr:ketose-bisphosphate aldolase [Oribacterium sp.]
MYVTLKELLTHAEEGGYTVLAPNVFNLESLIAVVEAAEAERAPVIIAIGESRLKDEQLQKYLPMVAKQMAMEATVPVGINLDHGKSYHELVLAIQKGFSSVMIDASMCPYDENVARTKEIVKIAHELGISVEAEIGHVGDGGDYTEAGAKDGLTEPEMAKRFAAETQVDALAVAVGTAHGVYKGTPKLDFERLDEIHKMVDVPLVLHGGSGTGMENLIRASELGIRKLNINTELLIEARTQVKKELEENPEIDYSILLKHGKDAVVRRLRTYMQALHSSGKAWH